MQLATKGEGGGVQRADVLQRDEGFVPREQRAGHGAGGRERPHQQEVQRNR